MTPSSPVPASSHASFHGLRTVAAAAPLVLGALLPLPAVGASASEEPASAAAAEAPADETLTVVGTRTERALDEIAASISVIDAEQIERQLTRDIRDLVRYEPGVSVGGTGDRFGLGGFTIRGIGGNRVLTVVDGVRVPEEFTFGPFLSARRDFVDVDSLQRAEIARGPISTLYGSDALGGVVALTTTSPDDLVDADDPLHLDARAGYSSDSDSLVTSLRGAIGNERISGLVAFTRREAEETETQGGTGGTGPTREHADPLDLDQETIRGELVFRPADGHRLHLTAERFEADTTSRILSDYGTRSRGTLVDSRDADDRRERTRYALDYRFRGDAGLIDRIDATVYRQDSDTRQLTFESRTPPTGGAQQRQRDSRFEQEITGATATLGRSLDLGSTDHTLTLGGEWYETDNASLRDGGTTDVATGAPVPEFTPLPTRDFPLTQVTHQALFLQDEIVMLDDRLRFTPGLRWDSFEADTETDPIYLAGNPGSPVPEDYDDDELTLKLGAVWRFTDALSGWARYSEGFRAPPYDDVNVGFTNALGGYKTIANTGLESETSTGVEIGTRLRGGWGEFQVAAFRTEFDNFIESFAIAPAFRATGGIDPADGLLTFQSVNRGEVVIEGVEARGRVALGALVGALAQFELQGAAAWAQGEDDEDVPVNSIEPLNLVMGLRWTPPAARWDAELVWTWSDGKALSDTDGSRPTTGSWSTLDLLGNLRLSEQLHLDIGVFNLLDETYIRWVDTAAIGNDARDRFTQPGRSFGATLRATL